MQADCVVLPSNERELAGQATHMALEFAPGVAEYVPGRQFTQVEISVALDVVEYVPGTQSTQLETELALDVPE